MQCHWSAKLLPLADRRQVSQRLGELGHVEVARVAGVERTAQLVSDHDQMWHRLPLRLERALPVGEGDIDVAFACRDHGKG